MGLFKEQLRDAKVKLVLGDIEGARKIITQHVVDYSTPVTNGIISRLQDSLNRYNRHLHGCAKAKDKKTMNSELDRCLKSLEKIKRDIKRLLETQRVSLE
jgi:hypothetical protein